MRFVLLCLCTVLAACASEPSPPDVSEWAGTWTWDETWTGDDGTVHAARYTLTVGADTNDVVVMSSPQDAALDSLSARDLLFSGVLAGMRYDAENVPRDDTLDVVFAGYHPSPWTGPGGGTDSIPAGDRLFSLVGRGDSSTATVTRWRDVWPVMADTVVETRATLNR